MSGYDKVEKVEEDATFSNQVGCALMILAPFAGLALLIWVLGMVRSW